MTKPVAAAIRSSFTTTLRCALAKIVRPLAAALLATVASCLPAQQVVTNMVTPATAPAGTARVETANRAQARAEMLTRPLVFEPNRGQAAAGVNFVSRGLGYTMLLSGSESTFVTAGGSTDMRERSIRMLLAGADSKAAPRAEKPLPGQTNYLLGNDPSRWVHGVQQFEQVRVAGAYPGIDVLYYGNQRQVEHDFIVSPGTDAGQIRIQFPDAASQRIGERGDLELKTHEGSTVSLDRPVAYQTLANGSRRTVTADYAPLGGKTFGFRLGSYDRSLPLVIDPVVITYSTYLGGSEEDSVVDLRLDAAGNMYVLMDTESADLPVVSQISGACAGTCGPRNPTTPVTALNTPVRDFYLAKLDPTGQTLLFATYIGGSKDDVPGALSIASDGGIYIAGETVSSDFPLVHEYSSTLAPSISSYFPSFSTTLTRLSPDGGSILYSSLIGGGLINFGGIDGGRYSGTSTGSLAVAPNGIVYLLGFAETADGQLGNFVDAKNASFLAADGDFLAKFDTTKTGADSLIYATTFGQPGDQEGELLQAVALDSHQNVWLFGTNGYASPPAPTANAVQPVCDGGGQCHNVFLFALDPTGSLIYSTFLGGTTSPGGGPAVELPQSIFIDPSDNIYLTGGTNSLDFPLKNAASASGGSFLTKLSPGGLSILYSTYAPLDGYVTATSDGLAADVGAAPGGFPVKNGISNSIGNMTDAAFAIYDTTQSGDASLITSSYLGATFRTVAQTATFDAAENLLFGGYTDATTLPVVNPYQAACSGGCYNSGNYYTDGFISRIQFLPPTPRLVFTPASYSFGSVAVGDSPSVIITLTNKGTGPANSFTYLAKTGNTGPPAPDGSFTETSNCPDTLAPGTSCTFSVTFKPGPGQQTTLTIATYIGATPAATATLSGTGVAPAATLQPSSLSFGNVTVGSTSSVQIAELTNTGSAQFQVSSITASDPAIQVHTSYCATPVTAGNYCKLEVTFAPSAAGAFSGSVVINYYLGSGTSASQSFSSTLSITGMGVVPSVTLTPASADFGSVNDAQTSSAKTFTVTNSGAVAVTLSQLTIAGPFQIASGATCIYEAQLAAGQSCTIPVVFAPVSAGANSGTLYVSYTAGAGAVTQTSSLTGTGVAVPTATLGAIPTSNFGNVTIGQTYVQPLTIVLYNTGTVPLSVGAYSLTGAGFSEYHGAGGGNCPATLATGRGCDLTAVEFLPTVAGPATGTVSVVTGAGTLTTTLTGTGIPPTATLGAIPTSNFGNVTIGQTYVQPLTIVLYNTGTVPLSVGAYSLTGAGFSEYHGAGGGNCPATLATGRGCDLTAVEFLPTVAGPATGTVSVVTGAGTLTTTLTGTGIPPTATLGAIPTSNFGNVTIGQTYVQPLTIVLYNTGTVPLSVGAYSLTGAGFSEYHGAGGGNCPATLATGRGCDLTAVEFLPTVAGPATGTVSVVTGAGTLTTTLTGTGIPPTATTPFIDFGTGFTADALMLTGPVNIAGGALQLTAGPSSAASSVFYPTPVPTASFTTDFTFQLLDPTAEGITFTIQGDGPNAVGLGGGGLGYQNLAKSIAVKFDLKDTAGEGVDSTGIYVNGAAPTIPATSLASSGIDLHSGHVFDLRLSYDGTTMSINLTDTVTGAIWTTKAAEDIPGITGGSTAYFGFTAGSGTPALSANVAAAKTDFAVRPSAVSADATTASATSNILSWIYVANGETKTAQTITFSSLPSQTYGAAPIHLAATASSGLPVSYSVTGPAKLSGSSLILTGAGTVTVTASQPGNASFAAAASVTESFAVAKAPLTVTANNLSRAVGAANPPLTYNLSGFVDGDAASAVSGTAVLKTTAVSASPAGSYPITFSSEGLTAANYSFNYVPGTLTVTSASCQTVNYSSGFTASGLSLNGGATIAGTALELTDGGPFEARSAFFSTALPTTSFTTDFTIQITNPVADGMTFVIQSNNPKVVGQSGGGLGYAGIPNSVAIKVDLHNNAGEGTDSTGTYVDGAYPSVPAIDMTPSGINLHSGHVFRVHLAYTNQLTTGTITDTVTGVSASMNFPGDITGAVGDNAWFGFTGGTGANSATQKILTWSYSSGLGCSAK